MTKIPTRNRSLSPREAAPPKGEPMTTYLNRIGAPMTVRLEDADDGRIHQPAPADMPLVAVTATRSPSIRKGQGLAVSDS